MSHLFLKRVTNKRAENYRPISLTSIPGKLLERMIGGAIVDHMNSNNLFSPAQHGLVLILISMFLR